MAKVLIQFAHPALSKSNVHRVLLRYCRGLEGVTFNDLYEQYPDMYVDIEREQQLLLDHDIIIFQHPFYWYSAPAIVKQWCDLVLEHNWAYGSKGTALAGKKMLNVISCGAGKEAYASSGHNRFTVRQFLMPFDQTAYLCKMDYWPPFVIHGTHRIKRSEVEQHGTQYQAILKGLVNDTINTGHLKEREYLNGIVSGASFLERG